MDRSLSVIRDRIPLPRRGPSPERDDIPKTLGGLIPGALFRGHQNAAEETKQYKVEVEIKDVDLSESFLCGYLTIHDLTAEYPNLTTFFEAEVIGPRAGFLTAKWDASPDADSRHWERFDYFQQYCQPFLHSPSTCPFYDLREHDVVFMRWKEHFLVPDHHVESVHGASYAGFYYIAYDMRKMAVEGYYYHRESKDFQKLVLEYVPSKVSACFEFR